MSSSGEYSIREGIPRFVSDVEVVNYVKSHDIGGAYLQLLKDLTRYTDEVLSTWLNISVKTFRSYKESDQSIKSHVKEQVVLLLAMIRHGVELFGSESSFDKWLRTENFFFDNKPPADFLDTRSGVRMVDEHLTSIEYGDNV